MIYHDPAQMDDENDIVPHSYSLEQNYPNPFNPTTSFSYTLHEANNVTISIFDLTGRKIETIVDDYQQAGTYLMQWDASEYSSGIYLYRLSTNDFTTTKKMLFMK
ncbi:MAG: T9SS type A sorting domain-containing protein [Candidatus Marinimicrobia bacterium]|nr:T9SS type A sorting domain-containing protein [Candidatus Neomarinimicrobiota bacterium]